MSLQTCHDARMCACAWYHMISAADAVQCSLLNTFVQFLHESYNTQTLRWRPNMTYHIRYLQLYTADSLETTRQVQDLSLRVVFRLTHMVQYSLGYHARHCDTQSWVCVVRYGPKMEPLPLMVIAACSCNVFLEIVKDVLCIYENYSPFLHDKAC